MIKSILKTVIPVVLVLFECSSQAPCQANDQKMYDGILMEFNEAHNVNYKLCTKEEREKAGSQSESEYQRILMMTKEEFLNYLNEIYRQDVSTDWNSWENNKAVNIPYYEDIDNPVENGGIAAD